MPPIRRHVSPGSGEESEIRSVDSAARSRAPSDGSALQPSVAPAATPSEIRAPANAVAHSLRPVSSTPPPSGSSLPLSREARIEQKLALAERRLRELGGQDTRARLLHAAVMRRDEGLLDAILASLDPPG
jgi:hypothetical protein